ncbi:CsbD family protein [Janthinobacterium sp. 17J80-10]|uniref:CsbD family protein n=1 Tax=Janthinobacterium sp. 17J80-10 TaxID=2497863 RepID=UPI00322035E3
MFLHLIVKLLDFLLIHSEREGEIMNKDQIKGRARTVAGKTQEQAGKVMGDTSQQAKGLAKQAAGKIQETYGNAKETVRKTTPRGH